MSIEKPLIFVSSKAQKAREAAAILGVSIRHVNIDLEEIQSFDLSAVVRRKAELAFREVRQPVLVDDVALHVDALGGFPGTFVRFWADEEGGGPGYRHAVQICEALHQHAARAVCGIGYFDGRHYHYTEGEVRGNLQDPYGQSGFGFDPYFFPYDHPGSLASMGEAAKNACSHRFHALSRMSAVLKGAGIL